MQVVGKDDYGVDLERALGADCLKGAAQNVYFVWKRK